MTKRAVVLFVFFVVSAGVIARASKSEPVLIRAPLSSLPMQLGEWRGMVQPPLDKEILDVLKVDDYIVRGYLAPGGGAVGLYVGYYASQRQGETMHSPLNCLPGAGWQPFSRGTLTTTVAPSPTSAPTRIEVNRYLIEKGIDRQLVLYWYQSHGRVVASEYWSKFFLVKDAIQLNRTDGSLVRIIAPILPRVADGEQQAEQTALRFLQTLFPQLSSYLPS
jgi:EpsI family protein